MSSVRSLRTLTRLSAAAALACVVAASLLTWVANPASAAVHERVTLNRDEVVERSYGPIPGQNPAGEAHSPDICQAAPYCDVVPLTVNAPDGLSEDDEYFIAILLSWDSPELPVDAVSPGGYAINDVDMYIYNDPVDPDAGEDQDGVIADGASLAQPEQAFLFKPDGNYSVVVANYTGVNTGYRLKFTWVSESFPTPFEDLGPDFSEPAAPRPQTIGGPTPTTTAPPARPAVPAPSKPLVLPPADIDADDDFGDFGGLGDDDQLSAPPPSYAIQPASTSNPGPPSTLALVLWLVAVPLGAIAVFGGVLLRRSAALFPLASGA